MAGNRNYPLNQSHYDDATLQEYVLGHLLPEQERTIRQHLESCSVCRAQVTEFQAFCHQLSVDLHRQLDQSQPGSQLSFDRIAPEWRKQARQPRLTWPFRQVVPSLPYVLSLALAVAVVLLLIPDRRSAALRDLQLADDYAGPPALVAVSTSDGLAVVQLAPSGAQVIRYLDYITAPRALQFSPDGRWLAFQQERTLHILEIGGSQAYARIPLHETAGWAWSADSLTLAYTDGAGQLAVFNVTTQANRVLVPAEEGAWGVPVWTADSQQVAYAVVYPLPTAGSVPVRQGLWRVNVSTGYRAEIARNPEPDAHLLVPASWAGESNTIVLAWDMAAGSWGNLSTLFAVDVSAHRIVQLESRTPVQGSQLAWPVGPQGIMLTTQQDQLVSLSLDDGAVEPLSEHVPWPQRLAWAANGAWAAYTVSGAPEGEGIYLLAPQEGVLRVFRLPRGAVEKAVYWAGPEHLLVVRQPKHSSLSELWLVPLAEGSPQRVLSRIQQPPAGSYTGWSWQDVVAVQPPPTAH